ncbi:MAG: Maf family protein [Ilumatobacteraceae bacterium]
MSTLRAAGGAPLRVVLASSSPRRLELLRSIGIEPEVVSPDVDESQLPGESARDYVARLAAAKLEAVLGRGGPQSEGWSRWHPSPGDTVIAADTTVDLDGRVLGKPLDRADAVRMLTHLGGRSHEVHTGVAVRVEGCTAVEVVTSTVLFRRLDLAEIERYVAGGEPLDKAGAYALQGGGGAFVREVVGSRSNVIGLPLEAVARLLGLPGPAGDPPGAPTGAGT